MTSSDLDVCNSSIGEIYLSPISYYLLQYHVFLFLCREIIKGTKKENNTSEYNFNFKLKFCKILQFALRMALR